MCISTNQKQMDKHYPEEVHFDDLHGECAPYNKENAHDQPLIWIMDQLTEMRVGDVSSKAPAQRLPR